MVILFNTSDPLILVHLLSVAEGREEFTREEQQRIATYVLDQVEQGADEEQRLIAERVADGRHPIG